MKPTTANLFGRRERGASLLVSLVLLTVMVTLGAALANNTTLEERMAGNTRDRNLALQAAEAALADAENRIKSDNTLRTGATNFDALNANTPAYWETCFEENVAPCTDPEEPAQSLPTYGPGAVNEQPQYVVERVLPDVGATEIYRVTARAVGGSPDAVVVLQAEFGYTPAP